MIRARRQARAGGNSSSKAVPSAHAELANERPRMLNGKARSSNPVLRVADCAPCVQSLRRGESVIADGR